MLEYSIYDYKEYTPKGIAYIENSSDQNYEEYIKEIKKIIDNKDSKVPPGIYAEYAYAIYLKKKTKLAKEYFDKEKETYPESSIFIDHILKKLYR
jgi:hypothetical protein